MVWIGRNGAVGVGWCLGETMLGFVQHGSDGSVSDKSGIGIVAMLDLGWFWDLSNVGVIVQEESKTMDQY